MLLLINDVGPDRLFGGVLESSYFGYPLVPGNGISLRGLKSAVRNLGTDGIWSVPAIIGFVLSENEKESWDLRGFNKLQKKINVHNYILKSLPKLLWWGLNHLCHLSLILWRGVSPRRNSTSRIVGPLWQHSRTQTCTWSCRTTRHWRRCLRRL